MNTMVIGIAGGTGSGKTTVTEKLQEYFGADVSVLHHDCLLYTSPSPRD